MQIVKINFELDVIYKILIKLNQTKNIMIIFIFLLQGDSGSGVIRDSDNTLIGVVSHKAKRRVCGEKYPDIHIYIIPYKSWIKEILKY